MFFVVVVVFYFADLIFTFSKDVCKYCIECILFYHIKNDKITSNPVI